jgi:hypothetical protein
MEELKEQEVKEMKKTLKGKFKLWRKGVEKFKEDPPIYRVHMMQGLAVKLTMYMIIFAAIYAVSIGFWIFALIIIPVGTVGNYYSMKAHFMKYKDAVKQYEYAGILKPIEEDISPLRRRWRIIEKQIGFLGVDFIFLLFTGVMTYAYFSDFDLWYKLGISFAGVIVLVISYFTLIYKVCLRYYEHGR